ncbi:MAG: hypothetical protein R6U32_02730 [Candidatus Woesearchaeota archaeon]
MADGFLYRQPREVSFRYQGERIGPEAVFEVLYNGLESLIEYNKQNRLAGGNRRKRRNQKGDNLSNKKNDSVSGYPEIYADVKFDDASRKTYHVEPRTNYEKKSIVKKPSIAYLVGEDGHVAIMREARKYSLDDFLGKLINNNFGNKFDRDATRQFYEHQNDGQEKGEGNRTSIKCSERKTMYIPEPNLLSALESLYNDNRIKRLTPDFRVIDAGDEKMHYLRDFLPALVDVSMDYEKLGRYFGRLHALGLMENLDRQMIHYCLIGDEVGNFDPDVMMHSENRTLVHHREMEDITGELAELLNGEAVPLFTARGMTQPQMKKIKEARKRTMEELEERGITPSTICSYLAKDISMEPFEKVELNR